MSDHVPAGPVTDPPRRLPLHTKILIGLVIGASIGLAANYLDSSDFADTQLFELSGTPYTVHHVFDVAATIAEPLGKVFLRLVLMVVVPLVFSALALGV